MTDRAPLLTPAWQTPATLKNTSRYPTEEVCDLLAFAMGDQWSDTVAVHVKNTRRAYAGRAYLGVPSLSPAARHPGIAYLVTIRLGAPAQFPVDNLCTTWKYHPWQELEAPPPAGYDPQHWGRQGRRVRGGFRITAQVRYLEPVRHPYGGKHAPLIVMADWREALVVVAAHEARHLWQFATKAPRSEVDAERHAAMTLTAYRAAQTLPGADRLVQASPSPARAVSDAGSG
jgi:hypothetical protein